MRAFYFNFFKGEGGGLANVEMCKKKKTKKLSDKMKKKKNEVKIE